MMLGSAAETLALKALTRVAGDPSALQRFLSLSGLEFEELRSRAAEPELLAAVLDFLLGDDDLLRDFCASEGIDTKVVHTARRALPGAAPD